MTLLVLWVASAAEDFVSYAGRSCAGVGECSVLDQSAANDTLDLCWEACGSDDAAATLGGVCCCFSDDSCPCLVPGAEAAATAVDAEEERPRDCSAGPAFDQFEGMSCGPAGLFFLPVGFDEPVLPFLEISLENVTNETASSRNERCWERCREDNRDTVAAFSDALTCACYDECSCYDEVFPAVGSVLAVDSTRGPPFWCFEAFKVLNTTTLFYEDVTCGNAPVLTLTPADFNGTLSDDEFRSYCDSNCQTALGGEQANATYANATHCECYRSCECLETRQSDVTNSLNVIAPAPPNVPFGVPPPDCEADLQPVDAALYDQYEPYEDVTCGDDVSENRLCFFALEYSSDGDRDFHRFQCFAYCANWFAPIHGSLDASYGDTRNRECCCVSKCSCFSRPALDGSVVLLALANTGPTLTDVASNATDDSLSSRPPDCPALSAHSSSTKKRVAPGLDTSDIWWIVLLCVVSLVAVAFVVRVEKIDKYRRRRLVSRGGHNKDDDGIALPAVSGTASPAV